MSFTHLHLHTEYSLLDGACRIEQLMDEVQRLGQTSVAVTDHGVMYGVIDFYRAAKKRGIKPIIGCEVYMAARTRFDKVHALDSERYHLILLCENETGYKNLIKLVSEGFVTGFYTKPRIDRELLEKYHEGLLHFLRASRAKSRAPCSAATTRARRKKPSGIAPSWAKTTSSSRFRITACPSRGV